MGLSVNNLEIACFLLLYKTNDAFATADALSITQRSLMQNLKRLEGELGFALFSKDNQGFLPTLAGDKYYSFFLKRGNELASISRVLRGEVREETLCIGWCDWIGCPDWLAKAIKRFKSDNPDVNVSVRQATAEMLKTFLYNGEIDIAITSHVTSGSLKGLIFSSFITNSPLYLVISKTHPCYDGEPDLDDLLRLPQLTSYLDDDDKARMLTRTKKLYDDLGAGMPEVLILPNWESVYVELIMHNGVAFLPPNDMIRTHDCFNLVPISRTVPIVCLRPLERHNKYEQLFFERLMKEAKESDE